MTRDQDQERALSAAAQRVFDACVDGAHVETFAHDQACGIVINWSLHGVGFGELTIARARDTGQWAVDDEGLGHEWTARVLAEAFPAGEVTRLDLENVGCAMACDQLVKAFDEIDAHGKASGRFGSAAMNALVDRYQAARAGFGILPFYKGPAE